MGKPRSELKNNWNAKTYKPYRIFLRRDEDADLIEWVENNKESFGLSNIFRVGVETLMDEEKNK